MPEGISYPVREPKQGNGPVHIRMRSNSFHSQQVVTRIEVIADLLDMLSLFLRGVAQVDSPSGTVRFPGAEDLERGWGASPQAHTLRNITLPLP